MPHENASRKSRIKNIRAFSKTNADVLWDPGHLENTEWCKGPQFYSCIYRYLRYRAYWIKRRGRKKQIPQKSTKIRIAFDFFSETNQEQNIMTFQICRIKITINLDFYVL